ncbi:hypothetical protein EWM64_g9258 [Hericium alpestre]|uniref:Phosphatidate phosphatase APP1 catalytic domain-containing protein n=1 Tax=Hericium alpestre TaxID=135208 RepID=A0A4Y9ZJI6_9AGAM|nr:hypothetical protein EWM64_g9258 [Hericium alpestre]
MARFFTVGIVGLLSVGVYASPAPTPAPAPAPVPAPVPQAASSVESLFSSITGAVASALPTVVGDWPTLSDIETALHINNSTDLSNISTSALLIPSYANLTSDGWNVRFYGLAYKLPNVSTDDLDSIIDGLSTNNLNSTQQQLLQNRTQDFASIPVPHANLTGLVMVNGSQATNPPVNLASADDSGEIDQFVVIEGIPSDAVSNGVEVVQTGITNGYSIVSDVDDVLRITKVYVPNEGLNNSFVNPYVNIAGVPELFAHWRSTLPNVSFHYDTTTPVELARTYVDYLFANYPIGSLDMRPINISSLSQILNARQNSLMKLFQTFPQRKFVLIGDTSSSTLLSAYPQIAQSFPGQVACIFIRNTSATDPDDKIPYSTSGFQNLTNGTYFFYRTADDLFNLDITSGQCVNSSIPQNISFGEQGGVLGDNDNSNAALSSRLAREWRMSSLVAVAAVVVGAAVL